MRPDTKFIGPEAVLKHKKPGWREWVDAAIFAVVAATLIRTFVFEAYTIPSGSMERTLLIKDFLFVSKLSYGPVYPIHLYRFPSYIIIFPAAVGNPIRRPLNCLIPGGLLHRQRGDVVVFNFPAGDTVINREGYQSFKPYYDLCREKGNGNIEEGRKFILNSDTLPLAIHPVDKSDNYIKRCIGVAGDVLEIKEAEVYINGQKTQLPPNSLMSYVVEANQSLDQDIMRSDYGVSTEDDMNVIGMNVYEMTLTAEAVEKLKKTPLIKSIKPMLITPEKVNFSQWWQQIFPYDSLHKWTIDFYGPIWIPKKGVPLTLTDTNYTVYERAIRVYEKNDFYRKDGKFYLNGKEVTSYTFKMDYYWMMGDNRHGSQDSRFWGFVPEDRIVGKGLDDLVQLGWRTKMETIVPYRKMRITGLCPLIG